MADGSLALTLSRRAEPDGLAGREIQTLSSTVIVLGADPTIVDGPIAVRLQVIGTAPTTLRAKAWPAQSPEPTDWTVQGSDDAPDLQRPGAIGLDVVRTGGTGPATLAVNDLVGREAP